MLLSAQSCPVQRSGSRSFGCLDGARTNCNLSCPLDGRRFRGIAMRTNRQFFGRNSRDRRQAMSPVMSSLGDSMFHAGHASYYAYQSMASAAVAFGLTVWFGRPMGTSASCIEVRDSGVHGKGVFAKQDIPAGTPLGTYPGVARSIPTMVAKVKSIPATKDYVFVSEVGVPLDPTDSEGNLTEWPEGSFWPFPDDITLARMNEPLPGGMVSVSPETDDDDGKKVVFITTRDISEGEEIFIDYGPKFDRSGYGAPSP